MRAFLIVVCLASGLVAGDTAIKKPVIDPNAAVEKEAVEVEKMVRELPVKEAALKIKTYSGTIDAVLDERVADVNEVLVYAIRMRDRAKAVCEAMDLKPGKKDFVKSVIDRHANVREKEDQRRNGEFLGAVLEAIDEIALPADDPNYVAETARLANFIATVVEVCSPI
ncbi:MAG: hypothetical protein DRP56_02070 [Planctomycetota bacterium]|nr:MAG: hypothetical protein DRP56_02070 [Planctomycetota bacterium]